jgi:hypothetical protein
MKKLLIPAIIGIAVLMGMSCVSQEKKTSAIVSDTIEETIIEGEGESADIEFSVTEK